MKPRPILPWPLVKETIHAELERRDMPEDFMHKLMADRFGGKPDSYCRRQLRARSKGWIDLHEADQFLVVLGLTLYDLEGYTYEYEPPQAVRRAGRPTPKWVVAKGKLMLAQGGQPYQISKELGVDARTVRKWRTEVQDQKAGVAA